MSATEEFVDRCLRAAGEGRAMAAVKEVVEHTIRDKRVERELSHAPGVHLLHRSEVVTVLNLVVPRRRGETPSVPHDHRMWAVVGLMHGKEDNHFFRRVGATIVASGERVLGDGEVLALGREAIHAVSNPSSDESMSALHVYGGDLLGVARSMWCEPDRTEQPYDLTRVTGLSDAPVTHSGD